MSRFVAPLAVLLFASVAARAADPLDEAFAEKAAVWLDAVKHKNCKSVGVLKFLVRTGDGEARDDVGDLNMTLANKAEVALILANTDEKFGILDRASEVAAREKLLNANHKSEDGRKAFFGRKYEIGWSRDRVEAGAFLTGVAAFSPDLTKFTIKFQVFDKSGKLEDVPGEVSVEATPELVAQAGHSYALAPARQKAIVGGDVIAAGTLRREAVAQAAKSDPAAGPFSPLADSPVKLEVRYNGKAVKVTGNAVPEPKETDRVEFVLTNPGPGTYAVVLLVNGENTLYQERTAPAACRKWVLPAETTLTVRGFQTGPDAVTPFKVLPPDEVPADVINYGEHAGTYRMIVFHGKLAEKMTDPSLLVHKDQEAAVLALGRTRGATRPAGAKPQSLKALQADLRGRFGTDGARGYVVKGAGTEKFETTAVEFVASPDTPVADVSLRYLTPKK